VQTKEPKQKSCKVCKTKFSPRASTQVVCSWQCASVFTAKEKEKRDRKEYREKKESLKTRSEWLKEAQVVFNRFIRMRDAHLPCVSCGQHRNTYDAGHYRSVGAAPQLRFNEDNVHKQCVYCNQHKSGNAIDYRINLVKRIGQDKVEYLESCNDPVKYTIEDAKEIKRLYNEKLKELRKGI